MKINKLCILKNLEYSGCLSYKNLGISETYKYDTVLELLIEGLIEIKGNLVYITSDGLVY